MPLATWKRVPEVPGETVSGGALQKQEEGKGIPVGLEGSWASVQG